MFRRRVRLGRQETGDHRDAARSPISGGRSMANVKVGDTAPDFTLKNQDNQDVTLSSFRGRPVVLVFYPLDFSGVCTGELCAIRDDYQSFVDLGAVVFGISRDSRHTHKAWIEAQGIKHDLLADMKGEVAKLYGSWND